METGVSRKGKAMKLAKFIIVLAIALFAVACGDSGADDGGPDGDNIDACSSDSDCTDGEQCYLLTHTCEVFCFDNTDCPDERVCTSEGICGDAALCSTDDDCQAGESCLWDDAYNAKVCRSLIDGDSDGDLTDGDVEDTEDEEIIEEKCPTINVKPGLVNFGSVFINESTVRTFTITNDSNNNVPLIIYGIYYDPIEYTSEYVLDPENLVSDDSFSISRGESVQVDVLYQPIDGGIDTGKVEITSNACGGGYVEVMLQSEYKGDAFIGVSPASKDFGNVNLGESAVEQEFTICNTGKEDGNRILTISEISTTSGVWDNFKCISPNCVTPQVPPLRILPGEQNCETFVVKYQPQSLTEAGYYHRDTIQIFNDSDLMSERRYTIDVIGKAESSTLFLHPYPVDFGTVSINTSRERLVTLHNSSGTDITINLISLTEKEEGDNCDMFALGEDVDPVQGSILPGNNAQPAEFTIIYTPTEKATHTCWVDVASTLPGAEHMQFPIIGVGKPANKPPVALVALKSHQQPMDPIMYDVPVDDDSYWNFYGDISYDPDAEDLTHPISEYIWSVVSFPPESQSTIKLFGTDGMNARIAFDVPGIYKFQLTVKDMEGLECEDPFLIEVNVVGDQGLWLIMDFTPGDPGILAETAVDCDLGLRHMVSGELCNDDSINNAGTCMRFTHAICRMSKTSPGAQVSTQEQITCEYIEDGNWNIEVALDEDCDNVADWQTIVKCWGTHDPTVTVKIYDSNVYEVEPLCPPLSTQLTYKGDSQQWLFQKKNGVWQVPPVPIN